MKDLKRDSGIYSVHIKKYIGESDDLKRRVTHSLTHSL